MKTLITKSTFLGRPIYSVETQTKWQCKRFETAEEAGLYICKLIKLEEQMNELQEADWDDLLSECDKLAEKEIKGEVK